LHRHGIYLRLRRRLGAEVGVSAGLATTDALGGIFSGIAAFYTGMPGGDVRLQVAVGSGSSAVYYCIDAYASGTWVQAADLVTNCWYGGSPQTPLASLADITQVELQITSAEAPEAFTDFCMAAIELQ
jgi:hypothetical protein